MPTIEVSQVHFEKLKQLAEPLVDTADSVIGRLLEVYQLHGNGRVAEATPGRKRERSTALKATQRDRKRAKKGERTPTDDFFDPLIRVLEEGGGELPAVEAIDHVGRLMADRLNDVDCARLPSGEVRWRNSVRWARQRLEDLGKLDDKAPYGVWKLKEGSRK